MSEAAGISRRCVAALAALLTQTSQPPELEADGTMLRVGAHNLRFTAEIENETSTGDQYLLGLGVDVDLDGAPQPVRTGVLGCGESREGSLEEAIDQWCKYAGFPIVGAVVNDPGWSNVFDAESARAFAGGMPIRGEISDPWPEGFQGQLIELFRPVWRQLTDQPGVLHSLEIYYSSGDGSGFVRLETREIDELMPALAQVPWPAHGDDYILKQFVVVRNT